MFKGITAIGLESHIPQPDTAHQFLRAVQLPITAEDGVDKFAARAAAHRDGRTFAALALGGNPHEVFAGFQKFLDASPEPFAAFQEILEHLSRFGASDDWDAFLAALDFAGYFNEKKP